MLVEKIIDKLNETFPSGLDYDFQEQKSRPLSELIRIKLYDAYRMKTASVYGIKSSTSFPYEFENNFLQIRDLFNQFSESVFFMEKAEDYLTGSFDSFSESIEKLESKLPFWDCFVGGCYDLTQDNDYWDESDIELSECIYDAGFVLKNIFSYRCVDGVEIPLVTPEALSEPIGSSYIVNPSSFVNHAEYVYSNGTEEAVEFKTFTSTLWYSYYCLSRNNPLLYKKILLEQKEEVAFLEKLIKVIVDYASCHTFESAMGFVPFCVLNDQLKLLVLTIPYGYYYSWSISPADCELPYLCHFLLEGNERILKLNETYHFFQEGGETS